MGTKLNNFNTQLDATTPDFTAASSLDASSEVNQHIRIDIGANGATSRVSNSNPLPVYTQGTVDTKETRPASASVSNVTSSGSNSTALVSNTNRRGACFYNDVDKACYLKFGATASTSDFTVKIFPDGFFTMPFPVYTGQIDVIWDSSPTGDLRVTEF